MISKAFYLHALVFVVTFIISCEAGKLPHSVMLHRRAAFTFLAAPTPKNFSADSLEDYDQFRFRYLAIGCDKEKGQDNVFYKACCHPRTKSDVLEKIPVECHISPTSMVEAHNYIVKSRGNGGSISSGLGKSVRVNQGSIEVMKPEKGRSPSDPPTSDQLAELLEAQDRVQKMNDQNKINQFPSFRTTNLSSSTQKAKAVSVTSGSQSHSPVSSLSGLAQVYGQEGDAKGTFFYQEGAAGACGNVNQDDTPLVALPSEIYEGGKHCGRNVLIKNTANGKTVIAKVQDLCPGCPTPKSLDLSTSAFKAIGSEDTGVLPIQWGFL